MSGDQAGDPDGAGGTRAVPGGTPETEVLPASFYDRPAAEVARALLGRLLISDAGRGTSPDAGARTAARIVETEAYTGPGDPASHASESVGRTERNDPMFGPPGTAYVHLNYGIHWCLNAVTGEEGFPAAVLVRAAEPVDGVEAMRERRGHPELTSGPARLTEALGIGPDLQRHPLQGPPLRVVDDGRRVPDGAVERTPRVGVSEGTELELRFVDGRSRWASR